MINSNEIEIISPQTVFINDTALKEKDVNNAIDTVLKDLHETGNLNIVDSTVINLMGLNAMVGKALVRLLGGLKIWWDKNRPEEDFIDHVVSKYGKDRTYTSRQVELWEQYQIGNIPENIYNTVPIRDLIPIAHTLADGYMIAPEQWDMIEIGTSKDISHLLLEVKNKQPKINMIDLPLGRDGSIWAWRNGKSVFAGYLNFAGLEDEKLDDDMKDLLKKAISRIEHGSHLRRK